MTSGLELSGLTKTFATTPVLRGVNLAVKPGEFVAVVGPSGCGKSTLLRVIAGLEEQDAGRVAIGGISIDALASKARDVAMVFQSYALYPHMTVAQNIALPLVMRDLTRVERLPFARRLSRTVATKRARIAAAVARAAAQVDLTSLLDRRPGQLSGGQRQRVALARALVRQPRLFLLDEPLSNLDAALRASTRTEIVELQRRLGVTTVYVTHDQTEAMTMADRIAVMIGGEIVQFATAREVYDRPVDIRVAEFIGIPRMNLLAGEIASGELHIAGRPTGLNADVADGAVRVGVRPEHLKLCPVQAGADLVGTIRHVEFLGAEMLIHVAPRNMDASIVVRASPDSEDRRPRGDVGLSFSAETLHIFDAAGRRLGAASLPPATDTVPNTMPKRHAEAAR